jgi:hypothetical protein
VLWGYAVKISTAWPFQVLLLGAKKFTQIRPLAADVALHLSAVNVVTKANVAAEAFGKRCSRAECGAHNQNSYHQHRIPLHAESRKLTDFTLANCRVSDAMDFAEIFWMEQYDNLQDMKIALRQPR